MKIERKAERELVIEDDDRIYVVKSDKGEFHVERVDKEKSGEEKQPDDLEEFWKGEKP